MKTGGSEAFRYFRSMTTRRWSGLSLLLFAAVGLAGTSSAAASGSAAFGQASANRPGAHAIGAANPGRRLHASLLLRADDAGLARYATAVSDPSSPLFGRHLTAAQVLRRFGPSDSDRRAATAFLRSHGLAAVGSPDGFSVDTVMTVGQAQRLFSTRIGAFRSSSGTRFVAPVRARALPPAIADSVVGVNGLNDRPVVRPNETVATAAQQGQLTAQPLTPQEARAFNEEASKTDSSVRANAGTPGGCEAGRTAGTLVGPGDDKYTPAYTPNQYLDAYGISRLHAKGIKGQGQRVALIEIDGFARSDVAAAAACFGHRLPPVSIRLVAGKKPLPPGPENTLDIQVLSAVAPGLREIIDFQGSSTGYGLAKQVASAVSLPSSRSASVISISLGFCEAFQYGNGPYFRQLERSLKQAASQGITVFIAAGDTGSTSCSVGESNEAALAIPSAGSPSSSPWVTAVGGTNFTLDSRNRITEEVVWNEAPFGWGAGGGGPSIMFRQPSWQRGPGIPEHSGSRWMPDIAMLADNTPGYAIYCPSTGMCGARGWVPVGGTSAATPLMGGILALANQQARRAGQPTLGHINPLIYRLAGRKSSREEVFRDVTRVGNDLGELIGPEYLGNNQPVGCCTAARYFDLASGWGSVRAPEFSSGLRRLAD